MARGLLLILLGLAGLLPGLQTIVPERQQELRVVLVAQNMARGGSWLIPEFQRSPRLKKPPLAYWAAAGSAKLGGTFTRSLDKIWVYRIPGVLSGLGLLFGIWAVGRRLLRPDAAFAAAVLAGLCFAFVRHGRLAETDIMLSMFIVWSVWAGLRTGGKRSILFWALCGVFAGLAFMTKGLAAIVVPPIALVSLGWFRRDLVRPKVTGLVLAVLLFAAIALPWYLFIWNHPDGQAAMKAEGLALMGQNKHTGPIFYYLYTGLVQLLPLSLLFGAALIGGLRGGAPSRDSSWKGLFGWFVGVFVLLSILPSKQAHYTVLLLAPVGLFAATWLPLARWWTRLRTLGVAAILGVLGLLFAHEIYPHTHPLHDVPDFVESVRPELARAPLVHVVGVNSAIFEFHVGHVVHNIDSATDAWERAKKGEAVLVIGKEDKVDLPIPGKVHPLKVERKGDVLYAFYVK